MDGRAALNSRSKGLSFPEDRARFHEIRAEADAILIGGNTARLEPYASTPVPLFILTRAASIPETSQNPHVTLMNTDLATALAILKTTHSAILIEAGPSLVFEGLSKKLIDTLYLSISELDGDPDSPRYDLTEPLSEYHCVEKISTPHGELQKYCLEPPLSSALFDLELGNDQPSIL